MTLLFNQAVTEVPWRKVLTDGRAVAHRLGLTTERAMPSLTVTVGADVPPNAAAMPMGAGVEIARFRTPTFCEGKVTFDRGFVRYEDWAYTRWNSFLDRAMGLVGAVLPHYLLAVPVLGAAVEYIDRFDAAPTEEAADVGQVIDEGSPLIAARAFRRIGPWHSHCGWLDAVDRRTRRLVNVDVDVADLQAQGGAPPRPAQGRVIQIRTAMTDQSNQPGFEGVSNEDMTPEFLVARCQGLRDELKKVLRLALTAGAAERIALEVEQ